MLRVFAVLGAGWDGRVVRDTLRALAPSVCVQDVGSLEQIVRLATDGAGVGLVLASALGGAAEAIGQTAAMGDGRPGVLAIVPSDTAPGLLVQFLRPGRGFVFEGVEPALLLLGLQCVADGRSFAEPTAGEVLAKYMRELGSVTGAIRRLDPEGKLPMRELRVALLAGLGLADSEIAELTGVAITTVRQYLQAAYAALGVAAPNRGVLRRRLLGWPPCRGVIARCDDPARRLLPPKAGVHEPCPYFPWCICRL